MLNVGNWYYECTEGLIHYVLSHYDNCSTAVLSHCLHAAWCTARRKPLHYGVAKERCGDDVILLLLLLLLLLIIIKTVLTVPNSESVSAMHHPSPRLDGLYF